MIVILLNDATLFLLMSRWFAAVFVFILSVFVFAFGSVSLCGVFVVIALGALRLVRLPHWFDNSFENSFQIILRQCRAFNVVGCVYFPRQLFALISTNTLIIVHIAYNTRAHINIIGIKVVNTFWQRNYSVKVDVTRQVFDKIFRNW